jgi:HTH-type transcriptional regulator/antitoxin HigA
MAASDLNRVERIWSDLVPLLYVPHNEQEYEAFVELLDALIDWVGEDETHPLAALMEVAGSLIERYEDEHVPELAETHD